MSSLSDTGASKMFNMTSDMMKSFEAPVLSWTFLWEFFLDGRTPSRAMTDQALRKLMPALEGPGTIIELGAGGDYYKKYVPSNQRYVLSNLSEGFDLVLDMTRLDLPDNSVEALISVYAMEHIYDFKSAFNEQHRVLRPGGRLLLIVPFMYYYHAAPDDFFRFSASALDTLLSPFNVLVRQPIGGRWLQFAEFLHEKEIMGSRLGSIPRFALRCLALPFLVCGLRQHDPQYAVGFAYLCEKSVVP
jgi:SAM-dependent methyltransferase